MGSISRKRVLFISPVGEFYGGGERSGFEFCRFLKESGYDVITVIPKTSISYKKQLNDFQMDYELLGCGDFECQVAEGNPVFPRVLAELVDIINKQKIGLVISNLYAQSGPIAAALCGVPNISMDRGQAYEGGFFSDFMAKFSDAIIVNSMGLADVYSTKYNIKTPIVYSYTAVPKNGLSNQISEQRIVCVSRISREKNLLDVLIAVNTLKKSGVFNGKVLMVGPTPGIQEREYKKELQAYIVHNELEDNVRWLGAKKHPWSFVGENDIYLNTSRKESVGRSTIEAIKLGLVAILADIPGHRDIFEKIGAISYTSNDTKDLSEKIKYVIENYSKVKLEASKAQAKAEAVISWGACHENVVPLIENMTRTRISGVDVVGYMLDSINEKNTEIVEREAVLRREIERRGREMESYLGVKRSARLLVGNIKRRMLRSLKGR